jgi:hypothetical protein
LESSTPVDDSNADQRENLPTQVCHKMMDEVRMIKEIYITVHKQFPHHNKKLSSDFWRKNSFSEEH